MLHPHPPPRPRHQPQRRPSHRLLHKSMPQTKKLVRQAAGSGMQNSYPVDKVQPKQPAPPIRIHGPTDNVSIVRNIPHAWPYPAARGQTVFAHLRHHRLPQTPARAQAGHGRTMPAAPVRLDTRLWGASARPQPRLLRPEQPAVRPHPSRPINPKCSHARRSTASGCPVHQTLMVVRPGHASLAMAPRHRTASHRPTELRLFLRPRRPICHLLAVAVVAG